MKKKLIIIIILISTAALLVSCIPGDGTNSPSNQAGLFSGIWHGWIAPISLIGEFFNNKLKVYEVNNTGFWYDLGFYAAIISGFGGLSLFRKKDCDKK
ncbi:hypothetical protein JHL18_22385 [Clostridium sp. YIM B02505]|uniref:Lipoprotein n=1 Tax=Clostridium yunnanense TaxID=2800325 RepID=A0ABS1EVM8_9CLOT|nr:hypothetical protein [Clostridium yunnanense]MBK1813374.1 hypothetical protein [Clostridium yunnanense]